MATATTMGMAFRAVENSRASARDGAGLRAVLGDELVHAIMRRLRRSAIRVLDMRTEFEVLAPGEVAPAPLPGSTGLAIGRRARRVASSLLDPWAAFDSLD